MAAEKTHLLRHARPSYKETGQPSGHLLLCEEVEDFQGLASPA